MDPNACLTEIRRLVQRIQDADTASRADTIRLADLVEALDGWLSKGGFSPAPWGNATVAVKVDAPKHLSSNLLNGLSIDRRSASDGNTVFIPLPRALWAPIDGGCCCSYCIDSDGKPGEAFWDTLAIAAARSNIPRRYADTTWTVHRPERKCLKGGQS